MIKAVPEAGRTSPPKADPISLSNYVDMKQQPTDAHRVKCKPPQKLPDSIQHENVKGRSSYNQCVFLDTEGTLDLISYLE